MVNFRSSYAPHSIHFMLLLFTRTVSPPQLKHRVYMTPNSFSSIVMWIDEFNKLITRPLIISPTRNITRPLRSRSRPGELILADAMAENPENDFFSFM